MLFAKVSAALFPADNQLLDFTIWNEGKQYMLINQANQAVSCTVASQASITWLMCTTWQVILLHTKNVDISQYVLWSEKLVAHGIKV